MPLGKGLASLIPSKSGTTVAPETKGVRQLKVTEIEVNPYQPRQHFAHHALEELISSIKQHGILQPLLVCPSGVGRYQLIAGERRLRAARIAGLSTVPVIVRDANEVEQLELALIENIQRSDLSAIEKAEGYRRLMQEFGLSQEAAAQKLGLSRSTFANVLRLLDLPADIQKALADQVITEGHAKILLGLPSTREQLQWFQTIVQQELSVQALGQQVQGRTKQTHQRRKTVIASPVEPHIKAWENQLTETLGTKVTITPHGDNGSITIRYFSQAELGDIVKKITS